MRHTSSKLDRTKLGNRIEELRGGTSQEVFAEELSKRVYHNVDRRTVSRWENGTTEISLSNLTELADYFNVSLDYITGQIDFTHVGNEEIHDLTGLSEKSVSTLRKWKEGSRTHEKLKMPLDGLAVIRLKMLNFLLENENIGLLDTLHSCIFGKFLDDNKYIELDSGTTVLGATNRTLQNAFIPSVTVCIEDLRDIAEHGQTEKAHQLIEKRHDVIAAKTNK